MKITYEDTLRLINSGTVRGAECLEDFPRLLPDDEQNLVKALQEAGVPVASDMSEKKVTYHPAGTAEWKTAEVPLETRFPENAALSPREYTLRGIGLEIRIIDYEKTTPGPKGVMDAPREESRGLVMELKYVGEQEGRKIIETAKTLLGEYFGGHSGKRKRKD